MKLTAPGLDGAPQLIAGLNGKRSPASRLSARGYGAPPPDQRPRALRAPALRPQRPPARVRTRAGARHRAVASLRPCARPSRRVRGCPDAARVAPAAVVATARRPSTTVQRPSTTADRPSTTVHALADRRALRVWWRGRGARWRRLTGGVDGERSTRSPARATPRLRDPSPPGRARACARCGSSSGIAASPGRSSTRASASRTCARC